MGSPDCLDGTTRQKRRLFAQELENKEDVLSLFVQEHQNTPSHKSMTSSHQCHHYHEHHSHTHMSLNCFIDYKQFHDID